jgi:enoyl-CoA hydratase/carnithine racemase
LTLFDSFFRYAHPLPVIAAINGHAPAGGCLLSMSCDYRIISSGPFKIGLNETQLGIAAPLWFAETMSAIVGQRQTEKLLQVCYSFSTWQFQIQAMFIFFTSLAIDVFLLLLL